MLIEVIVVGMIQANCFIVADTETKEAIIIDPGGDAPVIARRIESLGLKPKAIIATHGHFDHVEGIATLSKLLKVPTYAHKEDMFIIENIQKQGALFGVMIEETPKIDKELTDNMELKFGNLTAKMLHTPGHSPGSVSILIDDHLFAGDLIFARSIGRTDLGGGDYETLINSVNNKVFTLPEETKIHPGHGPDTTVGTEKQLNPFFR